MILSLLQAAAPANAMFKLAAKGILYTSISLVLLSLLLAAFFGGYYRFLLGIKYLKHKLTPLLALVAVALCTSIIIVVSSVMGGFQEMIRKAGTSVMGDVRMSVGMEGFPYYEKIMAEFTKLDRVLACTPVIQAPCLVKLPSGQTKIASLMGIDPQSLAAVTRFEECIYWTPQRVKEMEESNIKLKVDLEKAERELDRKTRELVAELNDKEKVRDRLDEPIRKVSELRHRLTSNESILRTLSGLDPKKQALTLSNPWGRADQPAALTGLELNPYNRRTSDGSYIYEFPLLKQNISLTVMPISEKGGVTDKKVIAFTVINEFKSGVYQMDQQSIFVPFGAAQEMLDLSEALEVDAMGNPTGRKIPARCQMIYVKGRPGTSSDQLRTELMRTYERIAQADSALAPAIFMDFSTREEMQRGFLEVVENEKGMITFIFGLVSAAVVVLIAVIFFMIVTDKTRDIGILRSLGASRSGVAAIFLAYGAVIGAIGALLGVALGYTFMENINAIHDWLGAGLGQAVFTGGTSMGLGLLGLVIGLIMAMKRQKHYARLAVRGTFAGLVIGAVGTWLPLLLVEGLGDKLNSSIRIVVWDRTKYFFDRIPSHVDGSEVFHIVLIAFLASVLGALIPALIASQKEPVRAIRYE